MDIYVHTHTRVHNAHMYTTGATGTEDKHDGRKMKGVRMTPGRVGVHPSARMKGTGRLLQAHRCPMHSSSVVLCGSAKPMKFEEKRDGRCLWDFSRVLNAWKLPVVLQKLKPAGKLIKSIIPHIRTWIWSQVIKLNDSVFLAFPRLFLPKKKKPFLSGLDDRIVLNHSIAQDKKNGSINI